MFSVIFSLFTAGLNLYAQKDKEKYVDKLLSLKNQYYAEFNKPEGQQDDAVMDNIEFELRTLAAAFASAVGEAVVK